ncbi:hypothetical protein chiPu_0027309, partial [Chiloscyllium punctatum]|nr:hypothetical protein [Chiloscyllium punctatum]
GGGQIKHENTVHDLVAAVCLPLLAAVVKIKAHQRATTAEQIGNHWAGQGAKAATDTPLPPVRAAPVKVRDFNVLDVQNGAQPEEREDWRARGAIPDPDGVWRRDGQVVALAAISTTLIRLDHEPDHAGREGTLARLQTD